MLSGIGLTVDGPEEVIEVETGALCTGAATGALAGLEATTEGDAGLAELVVAWLAFEPPPPPPQATSVVPNAAIAAIRIAKFWSGKVMAVFKKLHWGINYCPMEFLEDYAKARLRNREIKAAVQNFVQIQHNIVDSFMNIICFESLKLCLYVAM